MNLANKLTIFRIVLVPIMVIIPFLGIQGSWNYIPYEWIIIDIIFIIASITDKLDGSIARKRNEITTFGKFLDPIADKILVLAAMIMLVEEGRLPAWIPIIRLIAVEKGGKVIAASILGKIKTVTQMIAIILMCIDVNGYFGMLKGHLTKFDLVLNILTSTFMTIAVIATIFSGWKYIKDGKELLKD